jgi:type IX secretion system PorP/SprF family membrane protein
MIKIKQLLVAAALLVCSRNYAQDIHFTQFDYVPIQMNAAQTGAFEGTYRLGLLYRSQWNGGVQNGYQTPILFADMPIGGFRKQDWIGVGLSFYQDKAGVAGLTNSLAGLSVAYHLGFDRKYTNVLSFGVGVGFMSRKVGEGLIFSDGIRSGTTSADQAAIAATNYTDFNLGVDLRSKVDKKNKINVGIGLEHFISPNYNLVKTTIASLPARLSLHGQWESMLTKRISLTPGVQFRTASGLTETQIQAVAGYLLDPAKEITLRGGLGYRFGDAAQVMVGMYYGSFKVGLAYDLTVSDVRTGTSVKDGFELGIGYIGKIYKKPSAPAIILCPRY